MRLRSPLLRLLLAISVFTAAPLWAQDGLRGALSNARNSATRPWPSFGPQLVAADFDNDQQPDGALLLDAGMVDGQRTFHIEVHISAGENGTLTFASSEPQLALYALDIDRDGRPDLIVEQAFTHKRLQVWLNDGHGRFQTARVSDFPPGSDAPWQWQSAPAPLLYFVPGLPSRIDSHQVIALRRILSFDSSSSHWKVRADRSPSQRLAAAIHSPRAPPSAHPA